MNPDQPILEDNLPPCRPIPGPTTYLGQIVSRLYGIYDTDYDGDPDPGVLDVAASPTEEKRRAKLMRRARRAGFIGPIQTPDNDEVTP